MADTAKVFWSGRSQAVRLPKEYRFDTDTVTIRREGNTILLEPVERSDWVDEFQRKMRELGPLDDDFVEAALDRPKVDNRPFPKFE